VTFSIPIRRHTINHRRPVGAIQEAVLGAIQEAILRAVWKPIRHTVQEAILRTGMGTVAWEAAVKRRLQRRLRLSLLKLLQMLLLDRLAPVKVWNCGGSQRALGEGIVVLGACVCVCVARRASRSRLGSVTRRRSLYSGSIHHGGRCGC
jgi:hypothetical protein